METNRQTIEAMTEALKPEAWRVAAAKQHKGWVTGQEVTPDEFVRALNEAGDVDFGHPHEASNKPRAVPQLTSFQRKQGR